MDNAAPDIRKAETMSETLVVVSLILQALTLAILTFCLFHLFRSQGRLLLRLDSLERTPESRIKGLEVGTPIEDFQLQHSNGGSVSLSNFRGKKVLLLYWSPDCGFCEMAAEELESMQESFTRNNIQPVLIAYGDAEANRKMADEHHLKWPILLLQNTAAEDYIAETVFQYCGTPSTYLLDERGRVAEPLARGMDPSIALARAAVKDTTEHTKGAKKKMRPLSESRIEREGLKAGTPAPAFRLPTVDGETIALDQFRGRKVLLVFSDPQCGPCDKLAPHLAKLHREHANNGLALVMVGRGNAEQNKKKAVEHGIAFPVVVQDHWKLSKQYGTFATPAAFLIGQDGVLMSNVATGAENIMTLAREGLAST
jgi:peroxiredoxin